MFKQTDLAKFPKLEAHKAEELLVTALQNAHAGELAAARAYHGHGLSLFVTDQVEKKEILKIRDEELHHRKRIHEMLVEMGGKPRFLQELLMGCIGHTISLLCLVGGWFVPMYGAGKLESTNIFEYEVAARLAHLCGKTHWVEEFLAFGELEWDHEIYFRRKTESHWLSRWIPFWTFPPAKSTIRDSFALWKSKS